MEKESNLPFLIWHILNVLIRFSSERLIFLLASDVDINFESISFCLRSLGIFFLNYFVPHVLTVFLYHLILCIFHVSRPLLKNMSDFLEGSDLLCIYILKFSTLNCGIVWLFIFWLYKEKIAKLKCLQEGQNKKQSQHCLEPRSISNKLYFPDKLHL